MRLTRLVSILLLLAGLARAEPTGDLAPRFPAGATAYLEARGLARTVDALLESALADAVRGHPAFAEAMRSPEMRKLLFGQAFLESATGFDLRGLVRAFGRDRLAVALYGDPRRAVAMARVEPAAAAKILKGVEILTGKSREDVEDADASGPALWKLGRSFVVLDGDLLAVSPDRALLAQVRARTAGGLAERLAAARGLVRRDVEIFGFVDLAAHGEALRRSDKPRDFGQAFLLGQVAHHLPRAPWTAIGIDLAADGDAWRVTARAHVPADAAAPEAVGASFGGTLAPLPFALPERTLAVLRLRRSLPAMWTHRDALVSERAIPGLVEFETNFGNLTGGMSWVEQFLPALRGADVTVIATRRSFEDGEPVPAVRMPQGALLFPIRPSEELATSLKIAFHTAIGILNAQQGMAGNRFLPGSETYRGVAIETATYVPPAKAEMEGREGLPMRFNLRPCAAIVDGHYVLATTTQVMKQVIDAQAGETPAPDGVNAGLWLRPAEGLPLLRANREQFVAQRMIEQGEDRDEAARSVDLLLEAARAFRSFSLTLEEGPGAVALRLAFEVGPPVARTGR